jgi:hypothetical protein
MERGKDRFYFADLKAIFARALETARRVEP